VYISGITGFPVMEFGDAVQSTLENYFYSREPYIRGLSDDNNKINVVSQNNIISVVNQTALPLKAEFDNVVLYCNGIAIKGFTLGAGELAKLNRLFLNGEIYE
jgi:hypothetical protein